MRAEGCGMKRTNCFQFIRHPSALIPCVDGDGASRTHTGTNARRLSGPLPYQLGDASKVCTRDTEGRGIEPL